MIRLSFSKYLFPLHLPLCMGHAFLAPLRLFATTWLALANRMFTDRMQAKVLNVLVQLATLHFCSLYLAPSLRLKPTWCKEATLWKRPWCWGRPKAGGGGDDRGQDGWMASPTQWTWVWASSRRWWRIGKPGMLQPMGSQRVEHNWVTEQQPGP